MAIQISADSTCDLGEELIRKYHIAVTPLYVTMGDQTLRDGLEIQPGQMYDHVAAGGALCSTAAVNIDDYIRHFTALRKNADAVIHLSLSSELSSTYQNACIAAQEVDGVFVVDSRQLSTGHGLLVLSAAEAAAKGGDAAAIADALRAEAEKICTSFVLEQLEYMRKGGRCSTLAVMGANLLQLKPSIRMADGKLSVAKKYRGAMTKCVTDYVNDELGDCSGIRADRIFITHSGVEDAVLNAAKQAVEGKNYFREILITQAGCTISSHCGPKTIGVLFEKQ